MNDIYIYIYIFCLNNFSTFDGVIHNAYLFILIFYSEFYKPVNS
jgi:hypothetical protein